MSGPLSFFKPVTKRERAGLAHALGIFRDRIVRQHARPDSKLAKPAVEREETRYYSKSDLLRRWLKRGERRSAEGEAAGAILALTAPLQPTLAAIRESRERLDSLHGRILDLAPRLRDLCWAIDAAEAQERDMAEVEARTPVASAAPPVTQSPAPARASAAVPMTKRRLREWAAGASGVSA